MDIPNYSPRACAPRSDRSYHQPRYSPRHRGTLHVGKPLPKKPAKVERGGNVVML
jgi:hypothetical protein